MSGANDEGEPELTPEVVEQTARSVLRTFKGQYAELHPGTGPDGLDAIVVAMLADPNTSGTTMRERFTEAESSRNLPAPVDVLLCGCAFAVQAIKACRIQRPGLAWVLLSQAMYFAGCVQGVMDPGGPLRKLSLTDTEHRRDAMLAMRKRGMSDEAIGAAQAPPITRQRVLKFLGKRER
jgi:hypothetical protein